jgi:hypothetical protein
MRVISVSVSESDYEAFQRYAQEENRSVAQVIREAMALYRAEHLVQRRPLLDLPILAGHRPLGALPARTDVYDDVFER